MINFKLIRKLKFFWKVRLLPDFLFFIIIFIGCNSKEPIEISGNTMGTTYNIKIAESYNIGIIKTHKVKIDSVLHHVNNLFSTYIENSEISKFNNSTNDFQISNDFKELFLLSKSIYESTNYAFEPTVHPLVKLWGFGNEGRIDSLPSSDIVLNMLNEIGFNKIELTQNILLKSSRNIELDFSAIAKGFGVDKLSEYFVSQKITNFMIEIGGEVFCHGNKFGKEWKIGLQNPFNENIIKIISLNNLAMATSGNYRNFFEFEGVKYSHTIDPKNGYPIQHDVVSVSVFAKDCATADAYATALMVLGVEKGLEIVNRDKELEAVFIEGKDGNYKLIKSINIDEIMVDLLD
jgi:FAD:protein FMN transferase